MQFINRITTRRRPVLVVVGAGVSLLALIMIWQTVIAPDAPTGLTGRVTGVTSHVRAVFEDGQRRGNLRHAFTLVGDSISADGRFLKPIGQGEYALGEYGEFAETIGYFSGPNGRGENPFAAQSLAVGVGWTTESVLNPELADRRVCEAGEPPLVCEYRLSRPAAALIMLGTNDVAGGRTLDTYRANLRRIVEISLDMGVIPVLSTVPPMPLSDHYNARVAEFNKVVSATAREYDIPLVDYWAALQAVPGRGISTDGVHPNAPPDGQSARFDNEHLQYGYTIRNLLALDALDMLRRGVIE